MTTPQLDTHDTPKTETAKPPTRLAHAYTLHADLERLTLTMHLPAKPALANKLDQRQQRVLDPFRFAGGR